MGDQLSGFGLVSRPGCFLGRGAFNDDSPTATPRRFFSAREIALFQGSSDSKLSTTRVHTASQSSFFCGCEKISHRCSPEKSSEMCSGTWE